MANEADRDLDQQARELYAQRLRCPHCRQLVSLFDELVGHCPHCVGELLAGPDVDPAALLADMRRRRVELGLEG
jgi:hypothetical protein